MEIHQFGWNALTLGFFGTLCTTLALAWGLRHQSRNIWEHESGKSVSLLQFLYGTGLSVAGIIYGLAIWKLALILNGGILFLMRLPIIRGLRRYKGFSVADKAIRVFF